MPSYFVFDPLFEGKVLKQPGLIDALEQEGEVIAEAAKSFAPVLTGDYKDSIGVLRRGDRVYVTATDFKALFIEFGTNDTPIFAPLRRGLEASGARYRMTRRKR